jgi:hypothetical protein
MKRLTNFADYKAVLPYASELFGVYQPLLGWKSKRSIERFGRGFRADRRELLSQVGNQFVGTAELDATADRVVISSIRPGQPRSAIGNFKSTVLDAIAKQLPPLDEYDDAIWKDLLRPERLDELLRTEVASEATTWYQQLQQAGREPRLKGAQVTTNAQQSLQAKLDQESATAGMLAAMASAELYADLKDLFYKSSLLDVAKALGLLKFHDPFETFDPTSELDRVGLSPIGIVHLFRQYFFEFDTFLGTPVGHVWMSPGASVELIEISTRKTVTEKTTEIATETVAQAEHLTTAQDEISDAVKEANRNEIKFGAQASAHESWPCGSADQSASFDIGTTQEAAREQTHKQMRQQTDKLSTEIRKNYKSTFKTVTEETDTSSKRYVLANETDKLINYELRRKMRQVGVQVQDVGTYLCWQTYVDEPGRQLGVAKLMHIAKSPEIDSIPHPEKIEGPKEIVKDYAIEIPFVQTSEDEGDLDEGYQDGNEIDTDFNEGDIETIESNFPQKVSCDQVGYRLTQVDFDTTGADVKLSERDRKQDPDSQVATFTVHVDYINFKDQSPVRVVAKLHWTPEAKIATEIEAKNKENLAQFTARLEQEYKNEYVTAARERIKLASKIVPRKYEELREEERIVVYRLLIQDLLTQGIKMPDARTRHIVSELINSIFDVDKMLYFVAPEWWQPRVHHHQSFGTLVPTGEFSPDGNPKMTPSTTTTLSEENIVGWGGIKEYRPDNYYITDESDPAKLGSSLGWLLQLDGDNLRNAFLNAPWVKAVIPIRPGKERAATNWLKHVEGMNGIGPADLYTGPEPALQGKTMIEVLEILADKVRAKHEKTKTTSDFPDPDDPGDPGKTVTATPIDRVYEHGFYPLQGGFRTEVAEDFEIFDEWVEVLPTDQVVAVEVEYDPKTGRQI